MDNKLQKLKSIFLEMESVIVAYSGGIDSTLLLKIAHDTLGNKAVGITAVSASVPAAELEEAKQLAAQIRAKHIIFESHETEDPQYQANTPNRCYFCRTILYDDIIGYAQNNGFRFVVDGTNADDLDDHRPGRKAAREHGVRSPLQDAGITKTEIRELARALGLPNWDKPATACLASRIPYGTRIAIETLSQIEQAEAALKKMGFNQLRVRHHGQVARIEIPPQDFLLALTHKDRIITALEAVGYNYVTLDLAGFRSGSLNEVIKNNGYRQTPPTAD